MPITLYPTTLKYKNGNGQFQSATAIKGDSGAGIVEQVNGTAPTIVCEDNHRYICGEVLSLDITPSANGVSEIIFTSGSSATVLTVPNTIKWPEWFSPNTLETNATYQLKITNNLANVAMWPEEGLTGDTRVRIQKMLGIYEAPWELIREDTFTNTTEANHVIDVDANGEPFELSDAILMFETPKQSTYAAKGVYGQVYFYYNNNAFYNPEPGAWTQAENSLAHAAFYMVEQRDGLIFISHTVQTTNTNSGALRYRYGETFRTAGNSIQICPKRYFSKISILSVIGTGHYILYGKRKWQ